MYQQEASLTRESDFVSTENKGRLWKILQNNGAFNGINNTFFSKVREEFETTIMEIENTHREKKMLEKGKIFIDSMVEKLKLYKHRKQDVENIPNTTDISRLRSQSDNRSISQHSLNSQPSQHSTLSVPPYTSEDLKQTRLDAFDKELQQKQSEFDVYNAKPKPKHVDFKDKDDANNENVSALLEKAMREREELNAMSNQVLNAVPNAVPNEVPNEVPNAVPNQVPNIQENLSNEDMFKKIMNKLEEIHSILKEEREK